MMGNLDEMKDKSKGSLFERFENSQSRKDF